MKFVGMNPTPFALGVFFLLWIWIGWLDWRHQKIRHYALGVGVILIAAAYFWLLKSAPGVFGGESYFLIFLRASAVHMVLCSLAAGLLWWLRIWPAGDSKLFIVLGALYPVMNLPRSISEDRVFLAILINIFIPAVIYIFLRSAGHIISTRVLHQRHFLIQLGWRRELQFYRVRFLEALRRWPAAMEKFRAVLYHPGSVALAAFWRLADLAWVTLISSVFSDLITAPSVLSLFSLLFFFAWMRISAILGSRRSEVLRWTAAGLVIAIHPVSVARFFALFGRISIFSLFVYAGMQWSFRSALGGLALLLPFSLPVAGVLVARIAAFFAGQAVPWVMRASEAVNVALMGLFFGVTWVMVKIWDEQDRDVRTPERITHRVMPTPKFLEGVRQLDRRFYERELGTLYADGLTIEQAEALAKWCRRRSINAIPITPTMSFASWIFLGFFISRCLGGGHVLEALF